MSEAGRPEHNLRRLVGHANLLDTLMLDLSQAEDQQEGRYVRYNNASTPASKPQHIQWADFIPEEADGEDMEEDGSDSESEDEDVFRIEEDDDDVEEDLALTRTTSHRVPELIHEDDSDDSEPEDDSMPPSPTQEETPLHAFSDKQRQAIATTSLFQQSPFIPSSPSALNAPMPTAIAVC